MWYIPAMPSKYVVRNFAENQYYHVFNRGVEKRKIFLDDQDYNMFLYYLFIYLAPLKEVLKKYPLIPIHLQSKNLSNELNLISYCLMPNHFHLLLKQESKDTVSRFMKQVTNAYTRYFNHKYKRVGGLVQGRFKAVLIVKNELLLHISRYIHLNPVISDLIKKLENYQWSSYLDYINKSSKGFISKDLILGSFSSSEEYKKFVLDQVSYAKELDKIKDLLLED